MFFHMLIVMVVGVMIGFIAARSVRVPPMPAIVQADVDLTSSRLTAPNSDETVLRFYDITDIIQHALDYGRQWEQSPAFATGRPMSKDGRDNGGTGLFHTDDVEHSPEEYVDALISLITDVVESDSWRDNGGMLGSLRYFGGRLVVTQTPANQAKLALLLDELRQTQPQIRRNPTTTPRGAR